MRVGWTWTGQPGTRRLPGRKAVDWPPKELATVLRDFEEAIYVSDVPQPQTDTDLAYWSLRASDIGDLRDREWGKPRSIAAMDAELERAHGLPYGFFDWLNGHRR